jgi:hypothetical protein
MTFILSECLKSRLVMFLFEFGDEQYLPNGITACCIAELCNTLVHISQVKIL